MQVTLPDDGRIQHLALEAGFASVEEYLLQLIEREADQVSATNGSDDLSVEAWISNFREFLASLSSHNPHFDDSRESIYPVR